MNDLSQKAAEAREHLEKQNPTAAPGKSPAARKRIPLSVPQRKLETPDIPGYYLRWFRGTPQRLAQAERAGFEFVRPEEVDMPDISLGGDASRTGNSDMGARVSVLEGSEIDSGGQAVRMYLMKQKMEYRIEDNAISQATNDRVVDALTASFRHGQVGGRAEGETAEDAATRYVDPRRTRLPDLFRKKGPR